jgi:hypothetical protein
MCWHGNVSGYTCTDLPRYALSISYKFHSEKKIMIVSLDDQLEWQASSKTHSPRTPTAPEVLQSLRLKSPPTPSSINKHLLTPRALEELKSLSGLDSLDKLCHGDNVRTATVRAEYLCFTDGTSIPLASTVPLQVKVVQRSEEGDVVSDDGFLPLTVGSAWLSAIAEHTYDSQVASLLRARKGIQEIAIEDRLVLNRFLHGKLTVNGLKASRLWPGSITPDERALGENELHADTDDLLTVKFRKSTQKATLEGRRALLLEQQNRLRKLMARELQRIHSSRSAPSAAAVSVPTAVAAAPQQAQSDVSHAVANMLKRFKNNEKDSEKDLPVTETSSLPEEVKELTVQSECLADITKLHAKLKAMQVEWYRVSELLRNSKEQQGVLERRVKRLRYVSSSNMKFPFRIEEAEEIRGMQIA